MESLNAVVWMIGLTWLYRSQIARPAQVGQATVALPNQEVDIKRWRHDGTQPITEKLGNRHIVADWEIQQ